MGLQRAVHGVDRIYQAHRTALLHRFDVALFRLPGLLMPAFTLVKVLERLHIEVLFEGV